ncbi:hypothetical protein B0H11DRAFT_2280872 [Mycena galericulata]|nr:hypothetical protein B0H11DRAFT_2280872 [Mycena galericulata]
MSFVLPPELWLHIFEESPKLYLLQIQSVCRLFRNVSRPLLFSEVTFTIGERDDDTSAMDDFGLDDLPPETPQDFRREFEKLEFWSSATVSPHVRKCDVTVLDTVPIVWDSPLPILSACFEAFSHFTNLRELVWSADSVQFPSLRVDTHSSLKSIKILYATLVRPSEPTSIKLQPVHFSYSNIPSSEAPSYLSFLDPASLSSLYLRPQTILSIHLPQDRLLMSSFQNLHTLELVFKDATFTQLHACLSPFPAIEDLSLYVRGTCPADALPGTALAPRLRRYTGPCQLLPLVLRHATPTEIIVSGGDAPLLLQALQGSGAEARGSITSMLLSVRYSDLYGSVLTDIFKLFPRLTAVTVHIYLDKRPVEEGADPVTSDSTMRAQALFAPLISALAAPQALERAGLNWWNAHPDPDEIVPDLEQLKAALLSGVSSLADVSFGGHLRKRNAALAVAQAI